MKKILKSLLVACMSISLVACKSEEVTEINPATQAKFEAYLDHEYKDYFEEDYTTYHMSLLHPKELGIEKPEVTLGNMSTEYYLKYIKDCKEDLKTLHEMNIKEIDEKQQRIYRIIERNLEDQINIEKYLDFTFPFEETGVNYNLITLFTEFAIRTKEDVDDLIVLLKDTSRFMNEGIERTKELANKGMIQNESEKKKIIENAQSFLDGNEIQNSMSKKLRKLDLSEEEIKNYEKQIDEAVKSSVVIAYEAMIEMYKNLPKAAKQGALCERTGGKEYYEYLLQTTIGTKKSVKELMSDAKTQIAKTILQLYNVFMDEKFDGDLKNLKFTQKDASKILKELENKMSSTYPAIKKINYSVDYLDASVVSDTILAYYLIPPVDAMEENIIKVNPKVSDIKELTTTLAHEGFPGHLYQFNYLCQHSDHKIYTIIDNLGYSEGWAVYVQMNTLKMLGIGSESVQKYEACSVYLDYLVAAYLDMGIHYDGWNIDTVKSELNDMGLNGDAATPLYEQLVDLPTEFSPYGLGCMEMVMLREKCESRLKDKFNETEFHQAILDSYAVPFEFLEESIENYLS